MIGVSLPFRWLVSGEGPLPDRWEVFTRLKKQGVRSAELRAVRPGDDPDQVLYAANLLWDAGFSITVHGTVKSLETCVEDVVSPLTKLLSHLRQERLTITIHPIPGDNAAMLRTLCDAMDARGYSAAIALENNRRMPDGSEGDSASLVLQAVKDAAREHAGICFDMGHYAYFAAKFFPDDPNRLPDREFLRHVVHTHIHAVNDQYNTHFPLDSHHLPLREYLAGLSHGYFGIYNIELEYPRFEGIRESMPALTGSVDALSRAIPPCAAVYDDLRDHFDRWLSDSASVLSEPAAGTRYGHLRSTSYLFNTHGYPWAMDLTFMYAWQLSDAPSRIPELMRDLKLMIITHGHGDHFEERTLRTLAPLDIHWLIPDFLKDEALAFGLRREQMTLIRAGETVKLGPLTIRAFEGRHFRPNNHKGIASLAYHISAEDAPSLAFPGDVRDFRLTPGCAMPPADYCFAHVWLGDDNCLEEEYPLLPDYARYMLQFSQKNIFLTHLLENSRTNEQMWRDYHAHLVARQIRALSPQTTVRTPRRGEVISL